jgi:y4mF family transcriptional regulator
MKINNAKTLGLAIRERRKELHYTQAYLAEFTGYSTSFISEVERGKATAEIEKVFQLVQVLGLDIFVEKRG